MLCSNGSANTPESSNDLNRLPFWSFYLVEIFTAVAKMYQWQKHDFRFHHIRTSELQWRHFKHQISSPEASSGFISDISKRWVLKSQRLFCFSSSYTSYFAVQHQSSLMGVQGNSFQLFSPPANKTPCAEINLVTAETELSSQKTGTKYK